MHNGLSSMDASAFLAAIKKAAVEAVEAAKPVDVVFGEVDETGRIELSSQLVLGPEHFTIPQEIAAFGDGVLEGDRLVLLRLKGGQRYIVIGRLPLED